TQIGSTGLPADGFGDEHRSTSGGVARASGRGGPDRSVQGPDCPRSYLLDAGRPLGRPQPASAAAARNSLQDRLPPDTPSQGRLPIFPRVSKQAPRGDGRTQGVLLAGTGLLEPVACRPEDHRDKLERPALLWSAPDERGYVRHSMFPLPY